MSIDSSAVPPLRPLKYKSPNPYEVRRKILLLKPRTAPGEDGITSVMLRHLSRKVLTFLTQIFNHLLRMGYFSYSWKRATAIPILKPNKPPTDPNSYRPISLLSIVGKLFERVIASRLTAYVNQQHLLPQESSDSVKNTVPSHNLSGSRTISPMSIIFINTPIWSRST